MAVLTVQKPSAAGTYAPVAAEAGGDSFPNTGVEFFYIKNGDASPKTVTFDSPGTCSFGLAANAAHDLAVTVPAGEEKLIGPFATARFNDANNRVQVTYSAVTSVTVAAVAAA